MSVEVVGVDIGGTNIEAVLTDEKGTVLASAHVPARRGEEAVLEDVIRVVREVGGSPKAVGIGLPGQVDTATGVVRDIVNLDIVRLDLGERAGEALGIPVRVENDVNAAALGAVATLEDEISDQDTVVFLNFGTGLAAGVVRGGVVERGASGAYGEIGHIPVDPNQFLCACGQRGCLETVTSGGAVARLWPHAEPPMPDLLKQAAAGNEEAERVLSIVRNGITNAVQVVEHAYDPKIIVFGGGMAKTGQPFVDMVAEELHRREANSHFLQTLRIADRIRLANPNLQIGAIGAALAALQ